MYLNLSRLRRIVAEGETLLSGGGVNFLVRLLGKMNYLKSIIARLLIFGIQTVKVMVYVTVTMPCDPDPIFTLQ